MKGSQYAVAEGDIGFSVAQYQNAGFGELYLAVNRGASYLELAATINGVQASRIEGTGIFASPAADFLTKRYNVVDITSAQGSGKVIIFCPNIP